MRSTFCNKTVCWLLKRNAIRKTTDKMSTDIYQNVNYENNVCKFWNISFLVVTNGRWPKYILSHFSYDEKKKLEQARGRMRMWKKTAHPQNFQMDSKSDFELTKKRLNDFCSRLSWLYERIFEKCNEIPHLITGQRLPKGLSVYQRPYQEFSFNQFLEWRVFFVAVVVVIVVRIECYYWMLVFSKMAFSKNGSGFNAHRSKIYINMLERFVKENVQANWISLREWYGKNSFNKSSLIFTWCAVAEICMRKLVMQMCISMAITQMNVKKLFECLSHVRLFSLQHFFCRKMSFTSCALNGKFPRRMFPYCLLKIWRKKIGCVCIEQWTYFTYAWRLRLYLQILSRILFLINNLSIIISTRTHIHKTFAAGYQLKSDTDINRNRCHKECAEKMNFGRK